MNEVRRSFKLVWMIVIGWMCVACIPANAPPQLSFTPGPPIVIANQWYNTEQYRLRYPVGWRVITSAADQVPSVILAAPGNEALIIISHQNIIHPPTLSDTLTETQVQVRRQAGDVQAVLVTIEGQETRFIPILETVLMTVAIPTR
ncbi:MAG: hypothetical protein MUF87_06700 [Anaerolineae bacterium]|nr:hypothetical protein [Anaerolineae bacterium]